ncbi:hypothetical protein CF319_g2464 [Tilletia indica]|nr:hypothetical protein CF319_g2464 [Tilletia indica]
MSQPSSAHPPLIRLTRAIDPSTVPIVLRKAWVLRLPQPPGPQIMSGVQRLLKRLQADHAVENLRQVKTIRRMEDGGGMDAVLAYRTDDGGELSTEEGVLSLIKKYEPVLVDVNSEGNVLLRALDIPTTPIPTRSRIAEWNAFWPCVLRISGPSDVPTSDSKGTTSSASVSLTSTSASIDFIDRARDGRMWTEDRARLQWAKDGFRTCVNLAIQAKEKGDLPIAACVTTAFEGNDVGMEGLLPASAHDTRVSSNHPLRHAVLNLIRIVADRRAGLRVRAISDGQAEHEPDGGSSRPAPAPPMGNGQDYLLNTLTLFTTHEPCTFCTMALLHSRVRQVFFLLPSPGSGGCCGNRDGESEIGEGAGEGGGPFALHEQTGLNHHFEVWRWVGDWAEVGLREGGAAASAEGGEDRIALSELSLTGINP